MAYPPALPPSNRADSTLAAGNHAGDHNALAKAIADILAELGANPSGGYADLTSLLNDVATNTAIVAARDAAKDAQAAAEQAEADAEAAAAQAQAPTDTQVASLVPASSGSATAAALIASIAGKVNPAKVETLRQANAFPARRVSLICGSDDETFTTTSTTITADTINYVLGDRAWKMTMAGAVTGQMKFTPAVPLDLPPIAAFGMAVYIADVSKVTSIELDVYGNDTFTAPVWIRTAAQANNAAYTLVNGWNYLRWTAISGNAALDNWGHITRVRVVATTNAAADVTVGNVWAECPEKAQILFIADWGTSNFFGSPVGKAGSPYRDLRDRGIPVNLAWDPAKAGTVSAPYERSSVADIIALANDGNGNEIGIHGYDGTATSAMTAAQIRADHLAAVKAIKRLGLSAQNIGTAWRPAWVQNSAANASAAFPYMVASATPSANASVGCWPPVNRYNIPRITLHGAAGSGNVNQTAVDAMFTTLQTTRGFAAPYTHGVADNVLDYMSVADWQHFLSKVDAGIAAGWLECVTFNQLFARSGGKFRRTFGQDFVEFYDETGDLNYYPLP